MVLLRERTDEHHDTAPRQNDSASGVLGVLRIGDSGLSGRQYIGRHRADGVLYVWTKVVLGTLFASDHREIGSPLSKACECPLPGGAGNHR